MVKVMKEDYGNAAAKHMKGVEAERYIREAREEIAKSLKVKEKEIIFTSGGTESNNLALVGTALANRRAGNHLITTAVEHPSIYNTMGWLEEQGFRITYLPGEDVYKRQVEQGLWRAGRQWRREGRSPGGGHRFPASSV